MDIEFAVKNKIVEQLNIDLNKTELLPTTNLQNVGVNSIEFVKLIVDIEEEFNIVYPDDKLLITESGTMEQIIKVVISCLNDY